MMKKLIRRLAATVFAVTMLAVAGMETARQELWAQDDPIIIGWPFGDRCALSGASGPLCGLFCTWHLRWNFEARRWVPVWICFGAWECTEADGLCVAPRH